MGQSIQPPFLSSLAFGVASSGTAPSQAWVCTLSYPEPVSVHAWSVRIEDAVIPSEMMGVTLPGGLNVLKLAPGSETSFALQQAANEWINASRAVTDYADLAIDLQLRNGQVRWRGQRVVMQAPPDQFEDLSAAIAAFGWLWLNVERVERKLEADWSTQRDDAAATALCCFGRAHGRLLKQRGVEAIHDRQWFLRTTLLLERGDRALSKNARRSFFEFCHQLDLPKRVALVGEMIESRETLYTQLSERVFEYRLFQASSILEFAILIGILTEIVLLLVYNL
jgi:hypothetical protein